jgi:hypothetical protein
MAYNPAAAAAVQAPSANFLMHVDENTSLSLLEQSQSGRLKVKPGWVRLSIHPTTND